MYAVSTQRKMNQQRADETRQRGQREFFPKLQQAPGFVSFHLIQGDDGVNGVVVLWESRAHAEAFEPEAERWHQVLDQMGHQRQGEQRGDVIVSLSPQG